MKEVMTLTVTPSSNVDFDSREIIDEQQIRNVNLGPYDFVEVIDVLAKGDDVFSVQAIDVNVFDHRIVLGGVHHKILNCLSSEPLLAAFPS